MSTMYQIQKAVEDTLILYTCRGGLPGGHTAWNLIEKQIATKFQSDECESTDVYFNTFIEMPRDMPPIWLGSITRDLWNRYQRDKLYTTYRAK